MRKVEADAIRLVRKVEAKAVHARSHLHGQIELHAHTQRLKVLSLQRLKLCEQRWVRPICQPRFVQPFLVVHRRQ
jgi:hypothetical protein